MEIKPIAIFRTQKKNPYEAARQGAADLSDELGEIQFLTQQNFEQALDGIEGFTHLWLIYQFHHNADWKPKVLPPRGSTQKIGLFATRSPYRPNALGLSCVQLVERQGLILKVRNFDLLDETPIFDIKPYIPYADSFPGAKIGWLEKIESQKFEISFSSESQSQIQFLKSFAPELENFILQQLSYEPLNSKKKRVRLIDERKAVLAYRTWRIQFEIGEKEIRIEKIFSGYRPEELEDSQDPYQDKNTHRKFKSQFA